MSIAGDVCPTGKKILTMGGYDYYSLIVEPYEKGKKILLARSKDRTGRTISVYFEGVKPTTTYNGKGET